MIQNGKKGEGAAENVVIIYSSCNTWDKHDRTFRNSKCLLNRLVGYEGLLDDVFDCEFLM